MALTPRADLPARTMQRFTLQAQSADLFESISEEMTSPVTLPSAASAHSQRYLQEEALRCGTCCSRRSSTPSTEILQVGRPTSEHCLLQVVRTAWASRMVQQRACRALAQKRFDERVGRERGGARSLPRLCGRGCPRALCRSSDACGSVGIRSNVSMAARGSHRRSPRAVAAVVAHGLDNPRRELARVLCCWPPRAAQCGHLPPEGSPVLPLKLSSKSIVVMTHPPPSTSTAPTSVGARLRPSS